MLVLSRRVEEKIVFPSLNITVQILGIKAGAIRLGLTAPPHVSILRAELEPTQKQGHAPGAGANTTTKPTAETAAPPSLTRLVHARLEVAREGLALLQRQLQGGLTLDALDTLARIEEDVQLLEQRLTREESAASVASRLGHARRALLVEDNANERELLATFLRSAGMDVHTAGDGTDALDYLSHQGPPDMVLLDMGLPRCDGATAVRQIRQNPSFKGLKIFAVTGHEPDEFDLIRGPGGVDRWFQKPIDPVELLSKVNQEFESSATGR